MRCVWYVCAYVCNVMLCMYVMICVFCRCNVITYFVFFLSMCVILCMDAKYVSLYAVLCYVRMRCEICTICVHVMYVGA